MNPSRRRWARRLGWSAVAAWFMLFMGNVYVAVADTGGGLGNTPSSAAWITLIDAKGVNGWQYELTINQGSWTDIGSMIMAMLAGFFWTGYHGICMMAIWFLDWILGFGWVPMIADPLLQVGKALSTAMSRLGLAGTFLTIAAVAAGLAIMRGKIARGVYEVVVSCVILALMTTWLANPVDMIAGPGGWIYQTRDATMEFVAAMGKTGQVSPDTVTSQMLTTFVRQPSQLVSFGQVLDGGPCEAAYDAIVKAGPYGSGSQVRDAIQPCNQAAFDYANAPSVGTVMSGALMAPSALLVLILSVIMGGASLIAIVFAILTGVKAIIFTVMAVLPGGARRPLMHTAAELIISLFTFFFTIFFLLVFLQVVQALFAANSSQPSKAFMLVNIMLVVGMVVFVSFRKRLKASTERLGDWLSTRPGGTPANPLPASTGSGAMKVAGAYGAAKLLSNQKVRRGLTVAGGAGLALATGNPMALATSASKAVQVMGRRRVPLTPATTPPSPEPAPPSTEPAHPGPPMAGHRPPPHRPVRRRCQVPTPTTPSTTAAAADAGPGTAAAGQLPPTPDPGPADQNTSSSSRGGPRRWLRWAPPKRNTPPAGALATATPSTASTSPPSPPTKRARNQTPPAPPQQPARTQPASKEPAHPVEPSAGITAKLSGRHRPEPASDKTVPKPGGIPSRRPTPAALIRAVVRRR